MSRSSVARRLISALCILLLSLPFALAGVDADAGSSIRGRVASPVGSAPIAGVIVQVMGSEKHEIVRSSQTNNKGLFDIDDLDAGTYDLTFKTEQAFWTGSTPVSVNAGETKALLVTLDPAAAKSSGRRSNRKSTEADNDSDVPKQAWWDNALVATLAIITTAALLSEVTEDDEKDASPSTP